MRPLRHSRTCRYNHTGFSYWKVKPVFFSPRGRGAHVTGRCERRGSKAQGVDTENAAPPSKSIRPFCQAESGQDEMRVKSRIKEGGKRARGHPGVGAAASQSPGTQGGPSATARELSQNVGGISQKRKDPSKPPGPKAANWEPRGQIQSLARLCLTHRCLKHSNWQILHTLTHAHSKRIYYLQLIAKGTSGYAAPTFLHAGWSWEGDPLSTGRGRSGSLVSTAP